jgi:hypothetical protein
MQLRSGERLANMFIQTVCAVGLHMLRKLSSLVCKASSDYLAGKRGIVEGFCLVEFGLSLDVVGRVA